MSEMKAASIPWRNELARLCALATLPLLAACGRDAGAAATAWAGTMDTLPSGRVVVTNPKTPIWDGGESWTVVEDLRIGSFDDPGPYELGQVTALDVDAYGRIWALEAQAKEIRVFDAEGRYVRSIGRAGGGPGEFSGPAHAQFAADGRLWVADPQNNRVSVIDTTGTFVESHRIAGGFFMVPWPGGFDLEGHYYLPIPRMDPDDGFGIGIVRFGPGMTPLDTIAQPEDPVERERFEYRSPSGDGRFMASIPFAPGFRTARSPLGTMWGLLTGEYRLFEIDRAGDTLRTIQNAYDPLPVTAADREAARESLSWFTEQGGQIDLSRVPGTKPAAEDLFVDEEGRIWVGRLTDRPEGQDWDLFDREGRFLTRIRLPTPFRAVRRVKGEYIYGVTEDEIGVPYIVRARIEPGSAARREAR